MAAPSTAEKMSEAYLIYSEWSPARATPRAERLAACFPDETAVLRAAWIEEFERINAEIWRIAAGGGHPARLDPHRLLHRDGINNCQQPIINDQLP